MKYLPKIFLTVAIVAFVIGSSELGENMFFYMGRPVGAIFFVLFMIFQFLQKETALYDQQQQVVNASAPLAYPGPVTAPTRNRRNHQMWAAVPA